MGQLSMIVRYQVKNTILVYCRLYTYAYHDFRFSTFQSKAKGTERQQRRRKVGSAMARIRKLFICAVFFLAFTLGSITWRLINSVGGTGEPCICWS